MKDGGLKIAVVGAAGLVAGELLRLLSLHPETGSIVAISKSQAGKAAHELHRSLLHLPRIEMTNAPPEAAAKGADAVFCAMAHGDSMKTMRRILAADPKCVIDLAADFRLRDAEVFRKSYDGAHESPDLLDRFVYGLPEAFFGEIAAGRFIASPGCFATAAELALLPLAKENLLPSVTAVFTVTGSSGAGVTPKATTHHPFRDGNFFAYKMLAHQHESEVDQTLSALAGETRRARLLAHSGPFVRGIHATVFLRDVRFARIDLARIYTGFYGDERPFVTVLDRPPEVAEVAGTNFAHVHVKQSGEEAEIALTLDNLVKGAAGQAVQNMNIALGFDQTLGLTHPGAFPC